MKAHLVKQLEIIPNEESSDRKFINESFGIFFSEKYMKQQIQKSSSPEQLLTQFRGSDRYETMKSECVCHLAVQIVYQMI